MRSRTESLGETSEGDGRGGGESGDEDLGRVPFVLVLTRDLVAPEETVPLLRLWGPRGPGTRPGRVDRHHGTGGLADYRPVEGCRPPAPAYLLTGVERGEEFCDVTPADAVRAIRSRGRTPLTIEEGIALATQVPEALERNRCFMLAGSRREDRRVPALWISERAPKLGWCWEGNPHSWLGTASAADRLAVGRPAVGRPVEDGVGGPGHDR